MPLSSSDAGPPVFPAQVLVLHLDKQRVALPVDVVERVIAAVEIAPLPGAPAVVQGIINLHGRVVPVMNLRLRLGQRERPNSLDQQFIIVRDGERVVALVADGTDGLMEFDPDEAVAGATLHPNLPLVQGVIRTQEGVIVIHDVSRFLSSSESAALDRALLQTHLAAE